MDEDQVAETAEDAPAEMATRPGPMRIEPDGAAPQDEVARARMLLAAHEQERVDACAAEVREVLGRHGMTLEAVGTLNLRPSGDPA